MWDFIHNLFILYVIYVVIRIIRNPIYGVIVVLKIIKLLRIILTLIVSIIYFIIPVDFLPDIFIPFGWIDDLGFFFLAYRIFSILSFVEMIEEKKQQLQEFIDRKKK